MNQEKIGNFIKSIRKKHNLTQQAFADKLGVTYQAVSKWETGKNIPDIIILKEISKLFNVDIDEIIEGKVKVKTNKKLILISLATILFIAITILTLIFINNDGHFEFREIRTNYDNFEITGSAAYNKDRTSIIINNISYQGEKDNTIYSTLECNLFEVFENTQTELTSCNKGYNLLVSEYLNDIKIKVDHYALNCRMFTESELYLEIKLTDNNDKITLYKVPIKLEDNCNN